MSAAYEIQAGLRVFVSVRHTSEEKRIQEKSADSP